MGGGGRPLIWLLLCEYVLKCVAVCGGVLQWVAECCSVLQCVAPVQVLNTVHGQGVESTDIAAVCECALQHFTAHCNTLQHTATHCNALQRTATSHRIRIPQQLIATRCTTLHHAAPRCNALPHTEPPLTGRASLSAYLGCTHQQTRGKNGQQRQDLLPF